MKENESRTCALKLITSNRDRETNFPVNSNTIDDRVRLSEYPHHTTDSTPVKKNP